MKLRYSILSLVLSVIFPIVALAQEITIVDLTDVFVTNNGDMSPSVQKATDLGSVAMGGSANSTIRINNQSPGGFPALVLSAASPHINISGTNPSEFSVTTPPSSSIAAGSFTTFVLTFTPAGNGTRTALLSIPNNDTDENPTTFLVQGTGSGFPMVPEMDVSGLGMSITDGDTTPSTADDTDFGNVNVSSGTNANTFTITNSGTGTLNLSFGASQSFNWWDTCG